MNVFLNIEFVRAGNFIPQLKKNEKYDGANKYETLFDLINRSCTFIQAW